MERAPVSPSRYREDEDPRDERDILLVDDERTVRRSLSRVLQSSGYSVRHADCGETALAEVEKRLPDLVVLDICLPDMSGLEVLPRLKRIHRGIEVITISGHESVEDAVAAVKGGAYDYLCKPINGKALRGLVHKALENSQLEADGSRAEPWKRFGVERIIGTSPGIRQVLDTIDRLPGDTLSNILIEGETGTGKELIAHAVHERSERVSEPFEAVCCVTIPRELMESELFGYEKGAFTGALPGGKPGCFERASKGTIFLDEISELDFDLQGKLLRVVEAREFTRVGSGKKIRMQSGVIAATNRDLKKEVEAGRFRQDLYYRLNVVRLKLPPLRERGEDVILLAHAFMLQFSARFGKAFEALSPAVRELFLRYPWPGNVRELRNVIERIVLLERGDTILPDHLPGELLNADPFEPSPDPKLDLEPEGLSLDAVEKKCIETALHLTGGNVVRASRMLGLNRGALRYRMKKHGLIP
jgi:DNA-binding NtrC family response regulator